MLDDAAGARHAEEVPHVGVVAERQDTRLLEIVGKKVARPHCAVLLPCLYRMPSKAVNKH